MQNKIFQSIFVRRPKMSAFDLSHEKKLSFKMGDLIPILVQETIPSDKFRVKTEVMLRMAPMLAPIMHRVRVTVHYFFVPYRLLWDEWQDFITGGDTGTSNPVFPVYTFNDNNDDYLSQGSLADYLGLPSYPTGGFASTFVPVVSQLPFRAYNLIWSEYYRDQNLQTAYDPNIDGINQGASCVIRKRAWEKDYFTSALPNPQKGPAIEIPLQLDYLPQSEVYKVDGTDPSNQTTIRNDAAPNANRLENTLNEQLRIENLDPTSTQSSIAELRQAFKLQEWWEMAARGGSRYIEQILIHFGVKSSDARLQRPEYLGGGVQNVVISEVLNTAGDNTGTASAVGDMAGHGIAVGNENRFTRRFEEHGIVLGLMSVLPKTAYQQGIPKHFIKTDRFEFGWPKLAHIGEQAILNKELYADVADTQANNDATFGYAPRYSEYKHGYSTVHGDFKGSLNFWQMGRIFSSRPNLNESFIESDPTDRIYAVQDGTDQLWCHLYNDVTAVRPLPYFSDPSLV